MKKIILFVIFLFLSSNLASAVLNIEINIKDSFITGETINFNYKIISDQDQSVIYISHVNCPNAPTTFLEEKIVNLKSNQPFEDTYYDLIIDDSIEPQTCTAYIQILSPIQQKIEKNFTIITNPSFSFELKNCKDQSCLEKSKVFVQNKEIYLDYESEVENPSITTTLISPDNTKQQITLPTSIKAEQIGTYNLEVTASKEGYKTITKTEQFGVIEKEANIPYIKSEEDIIKKEFNILYIIVPFILIILGIISYIIYRKTK